VSYAVIALLADPKGDPLMYWCGYEPQKGAPGAGCHRWLPGVEGRKQAVKFIDVDNAMKAGVGAPNTPYGRGDEGPYRGVSYAVYSDEHVFVSVEVRNHGT